MKLPFPLSYTKEETWKEGMKSKQNVQFESSLEAEAIALKI